MSRAYASLPGPRGLPFIGSALQARSGRFHLQLEAWAERHGPLFRMQLGRTRMLVMSDPQEISAVLRERPDGFSRVQRMRRIAIELGMKEGVFSAGGELWRAQRGMVTKAFSPANVGRWTPDLVDVVERLSQRWERAARAGDTLDLQGELMRYTVDVVAGLALGARVDTIGGGDDVMQRDLDRIFPALFRRALAPVPTWRWYRTAADRELGHAMQRVNRTIDSLIDAARERLDAQPRRRASPPNLLEALIVANDEGADGMDDEIIAGNVMTMLLAGEDTTANTLAWTLFLLRKNPHAMQRARAEVDALMQPEARMDANVLPHLPWLDACAREALRLRPVAPILPVEAIKDTIVAGVQVSAGTVVVPLLRRAGTDPAQVDDAQRFRPERWLDDGGMQSMPPRLSMPFGAGPRMCPGRWLAMLEIRALLAMLISRYDIVSLDTPDGADPPEHLALTMAPVGLSLRLALRGESRTGWQR